MLLEQAGRPGGATVAELLAADKAAPIAWRSLGWLIKSGLLRVAPADSDGVMK
jgi:hypothetical protein